MHIIELIIKLCCARRTALLGEAVSGCTCLANARYAALSSLSELRTGREDVGVVKK